MVLNFTVPFLIKGGELPHPIYPGLYIKKIGHIGLPLTEHQTQQVIELCEQAPYGKKDKTIVDKSVRNTWQLNPSQFQLKNTKYDPIHIPYSSNQMERLSRFHQTRNHERSRRFKFNRFTPLQTLTLRNRRFFQASSRYRKRG